MKNTTFQETTPVRKQPTFYYENDAEINDNQLVPVKVGLKSITVSSITNGGNGTFWDNLHLTNRWNLHVLLYTYSWKVIK